MTLEFTITNWFVADDGPEEVRQTTGSLRIALGKQVVTRVDDDWSKSVREEVFVSVYPLALWFASSWWRLRWEPAPQRDIRPSVSWRMAHEVAAAGCGYLWPRLGFESDGESIELICRSSAPTPGEPIRYLTDFRASVTAAEFEHAVETFINLMLARLRAVGVQPTHLQDLWNEVCEERTNTDVSTYRRLEAMLGYEPDEAPETTVTRLESLSSEAGETAISEIASACSGNDPEGTLVGIIDLARSKGIDGRIRSLDRPTDLSLSSAALQDVPWEKGWQLARFARDKWGVETDQVPDETLSDILEFDKTYFPVKFSRRMFK